MSLWRQVTRGLRVLANRSAADRDVADEVQHYLDRATDELLAKGVPLDQARRTARLEVGNAGVVRDQVRAAGWEHLVETLLADIRYGARRLRRHPGFTVVTSVTLALGIGASTAIFSAVNPILFAALPYPGAGRIVSIADFAQDGSRLAVTFGTFCEIAERTRSFESVAAMKRWQPTMTDAAPAERLEGQRVSAGYFRALGVSPSLGRDFGEGDDRLDGPHVAVLSDALWRRRFGADPTIVGRDVTIDDRLYSIIGVMPRGFENITAPSAELWAPLQYDRSLQPDSREWGHHLRMIGRLRPNVAIGAARRELDAMAHHPVAEFVRPPYAALDRGLITTSLQDDVTSGARPALLAVVGAVLLLLAIACVNVTNLLLARGAERRAEFAMRIALGAGRARLVRQLLTESLLMAGVGGMLGFVVAVFGVNALVALAPPELPRAGAIAVDRAVFAFALAVTTIVGLAVGVIPALYASRGDIDTRLRQGSRRTAGDRQMARRALVAAEVALALVLLVGAGLLLRSLERLFAVDPGFNPSHVLAMQVQTAGLLSRDAEETRRFFDRAVEAVRRVPGVEAAGLTSQLPLSGGPEDGYGVHFESSPTGNPEADNGAYRYAVTPGYLETMGIPLRRGRRLDASDIRTAPLAVLVSQSLAKSKFGNQDPVGERLRIGPSDGPWYTVVGVVGNVRQTSLAIDQSDAVYMTTAQWLLFADKALWLVIRARGDAASLAPDVEKAIWSVRKDQPIVKVATLEALVRETAAQRRFALILFEAFAFVALVLAATGIYGVLSGRVNERTREIGVRAALGASRREILGLVMGEATRLTGVGVLVGLAGAAVASRALITLLFGVSRLDPVTYAGVVALVAAVSALACAVPAWRAARVDPATTLRAE